MAGAPDLLSEFPEAGVNTGGDAFNIAIYTIVSMAVLVGITYLLGKAFSNRKLEDWSKSEFLQVLISAALVGGLFFLMAPGTGVVIVAFDSLIPEDISIPYIAGAADVSSVTPSSIPITADGCGDGPVPSGTLLCFASTYLKALSAQIGSVLVTMIVSSTVLDIISKISIDVVIVEVTPLSGLSSIVQVLNTLMQSLLFLGIAVNVGIGFLDFIGATALSLFLPIGVVLRSFFATRRIGGLLIGLAVGLYLVFPLTLAMNAVAVQSTAENSEGLQRFMAFSAAVEEMNPLNTFSTPGALLDPGKWTEYSGDFIGGIGAFVDLMSHIPETLIAIISFLMIQIVVLPLLSIVITIIAIKELGGFFGSELNMSKFEV